jgi:hypothetical protein
MISGFHFVPSWLRYCHLDERSEERSPEAMEISPYGRDDSNDCRDDSNYGRDDSNNNFHPLRLSVSAVILISRIKNIQISTV